MTSLRKLAVLAALAIGVSFTPLPTAQAANTFGDSGHSHFDVHNYANHEVTFCYRITGQAVGASGEIFNLPNREMNGSNNMELRGYQDGMHLVRRVAGVATTLTSSLPNPNLTFGVGTEVMFDYTMVGSTFTLYDFTNKVRGAALYQWTDTTYPTGVSISYYTIGGWMGVWEEAHGRPLDATGQPHDINAPGITQDARAHTQVGTEATFDSSSPAPGGTSSLVTNATAGLASGANYTYTITTTGSGTGFLDTRDPGLSSDTVFFSAGWLRFTPGGSLATLKRYTGTGLLVDTVTAPWGGAGTYTLQYVGSTATLTRAGSAGSAVSLNNNTSGLRVREQSLTNGQVLSWSGTVNP